MNPHGAKRKPRKRLNGLRMIVTKRHVKYYYWDSSKWATGFWQLRGVENRKKNDGLICGIY